MTPLSIKDALTALDIKLQRKLFSIFNKDKHNFIFWGLFTLLLFSLLIFDPQKRSFTRFYIFESTEIIRISSRIYILYSMAVLISIVLGFYTWFFKFQKNYLPLLFITAMALFIDQSLALNNSIKGAHKQNILFWFYFLQPLFFWMIYELLRKKRFLVRWVALISLQILFFFIIHEFRKTSPNISDWFLNRPIRWIFVWSALLMQEVVDQKYKKNILERACFFFLPTNFIYPLPLSYPSLSDIHHRKSELRYSGLRDIWMGYGVGFLTLWIIQTDWEISHWFFRGLHNYIEIFGVSYFCIVVPIGCLKWIGFQLPDAYDHPLLACNPNERWRTWNTYFYNWFYHFIFFPVYKNTKSILLSVLLTFMVTTLMHLNGVIFHIFSFDFSVVYDRSFQRVFTFFLLHGFAVYFYLKTSKWWPKADQTKGWYGVLLTWLMMIGIHATK